MQIQVSGRVIEITVKRSRRSNRLRLSVYPGGEARITVPYGMSDERIESFAKKFVQEKGEWLLKAIDKLKKYAPQGPKRTVAEIRKEYLEYKSIAKKLVTERLEFFNKIYGFKIGNITIRNQKSRWGSCSRRGNLNFNYRVALLPPELLDYIVVHELSHIGQMNHSKKFWDLVAKTIPDFKEKRKRLHGGFSLL